MGFNRHLLKNNGYEANMPTLWLLSKVLAAKNLVSPGRLLFLGCRRAFLLHWGFRV
jgi:hypothetical protein